MKRHFPFAVLVSLVFAGILAGCGMVQIANGEAEISRLYRSIEIPANETHGATVCYFCNIVVDGHVTGTVVTLGGDITVRGAVDESAVAAIGDIRIAPGATVLDEAVAAGGTVTNQGNVSGSIESLPLKGLQWLPGRWRAQLVLFILAACFSTFSILIYWPFIRATRIARIEAKLTRRWYLAALAGMVIFALVVGLAYAGDALDDRYKNDVDVWFFLAGLLIYAVISTPGWAAICTRFARNIHVARRPIPAALFGGLILVAITAIPFAGWLLALLLLIYSAGTTLVNRFGRAERVAVSSASGLEA